MKNKIVVYLMGFLSGMMLLSGGYAAASMVLSATPTSQSFYVNGQRVQFEAYEIHGNNFVKLRDIGKTVDFAVDYNAADNSVLINSGLPYQEEVTQPAQATPAPSALITEADVHAVLASLEALYPSGTVYPTPYHTISSGPYTNKGVHCAGWAMLCSDAAFGTLPYRKVDRPSWNQIRPGDIVEYRNENAYHAIVVVEKTDEYVYVTESGNHNKALWGGQYFKWWLESQPQYILYTRYPN